MQHNLPEQEILKEHKEQIHEKKSLSRTPNFLIEEMRVRQDTSVKISGDKPQVNNSAMTSLDVGFCF